MKSSVILFLFILTSQLEAQLEPGDSFYPYCYKEVGKQSVLYSVKQSHGHLLVNFNLAVNDVFEVLNEMNAFVNEARIHCSEQPIFLSDYCSNVTQLDNVRRKSVEFLRVYRFDETEMYPKLYSSNT